MDIKGNSSERHMAPRVLLQMVGQSSPGSSQICLDQASVAQAPAPCQRRHYSLLDKTASSCQTEVVPPVELVYQPSMILAFFPPALHRSFWLIYAGPY